MRVLKIGQAIVLALGLSLSLGAIASSFDELDAQLDAEFETLDAELEAKYQALDAALEAAYKKFDAEVKGVWGNEAAELPSETTWVDYSADKKVRRKVDFDAGQVIIEAVLDEKTTTDVTLGTEIADLVSSMKQAAATVTSDTIADLAAKDQVLQYAKQSLAEQNIELAPYEQTDTAPVLGSVVGAMPKPEVLGALVLQELSKAVAVGEAEVVDSSFDSGKATVSLTKTKDDKKIVSIKVPLRFGFKSSLAARYRETVLRQAARQDIPASLVYAVMETESSFNPRARSGVPAFGLMQLVPRSGAMDAYQHVYGEKLLLDPEYLFDAQQNVELGAAYLNLLFTRYLRHIDDPKSRAYCTIAAYNTGAGNVAKSFTGKTNVRTAAKLINVMEADAVYEHLLEKLPYEETRRYLKKVTKAQKKYVGLDREV